MLPTAILVDAGYFLKRFPWIYPDKKKDACEVAKTLHTMAYSHLDWKSNDSNEDQSKNRHESPRLLYRIFVYDCPPIDKRFTTPIEKKEFDYNDLKEARFRTKFHTELLKLRKVALRLGTMSYSDWGISPKAMAALLSNKKNWSELTDKDFVLNVKQKGVDMRLGLDIASLAHKRLVDQIVLVAGDADFVPAVKHARREGVDVILDPLWQRPSKNLLHNIDGMRSVAPQPTTIKKS